MTSVYMFLLQFIHHSPSSLFLFFFFNDPSTTEIYTLSLHDALPICSVATGKGKRILQHRALHPQLDTADNSGKDRKSTRLNSSHANISYAVFCLKKKKNKHQPNRKPKHTRTQNQIENDNHTHHDKLK